IRAKAVENYSADSLASYDRNIRESFVMKDLKKYKGMHQLLKEEDPELLFDRLPRALNEAAYEMFLIDGETKAAKQKKAIDLIKKAAGGPLQLAKLGYKGWRAMNG